MSPLVALALAVVALIVVSRLRGGGKVSQSIVRQKIAAGAKVVDVRSPEEFRGGAYAGAVNIPLQDLTRRLAEIPKEKPVVIYCASGGRSAVGAQLLRRAGYADVVNAGGLGDMPR